MKKYLVITLAMLALGLTPMVASANATTNIVKPSEHKVVLKGELDHQIVKVHRHGHGSYYYYTPYGYDYYYSYPYGNYYYYYPGAGIYFGW